MIVIIETVSIPTVSCEVNERKNQLFLICFPLFLFSFDLSYRIQASVPLTQPHSI